MELPPLLDVIKAHDLWAKKSLGQNFLTDPSILRRIVDVASPLDGRHVIEVGPGPGGLTRQILSREIASLHVFEKDKRCIDIMHELQEHFPKLEIHEADAMDVDLSVVGDTPRKIISNLPYNISVPLLIRWLRGIDCFESLTLMFQKEVADRITAKPSTSDYGRLSIISQWAAIPKKAFDLPPGAFKPAPKVTSTVVHFIPRSDRPRIEPDLLEKITAAAFSQRRKMLRSSLKSLGVDTETLLNKAGIDSTKRAEELSVAEFVLLAEVFAENR